MNKNMNKGEPEIVAGTEGLKNIRLDIEVKDVRIEGLNGTLVLEINDTPYKIPFGFSINNLIKVKIK